MRCPPASWQPDDDESDLQEVKGQAASASRPPPALPGRTLAFAMDGARPSALAGACLSPRPRSITISLLRSKSALVRDLGRGLPHLQ